MSAIQVMESWHARNKEKLAAYKRQYYKSHPEYRLKKIQKALACPLLPAEDFAGTRNVKRVGLATSPLVVGGVLKPDCPTT